MPGLKDRNGLKCIEAKAEDMPSYDDRDEEVYDGFDCQIVVTIHGNSSKYGRDEDSKAKLLEDVKNWLVADNDNKEYLKVLKQEIVQSEETFHQVDSTLILDSSVLNEFIGNVQDSLF